MDRYTFVKLLGKGSFGSAWVIQRKSDKVSLVAKEIRLAGLKPAEREEAKKEITTLSAIHHPNITNYIEHFEDNGSLFIVMEYANGGDLYGKIRSRKGVHLEEREVLHYFVQLCLALSYLHSRRILHRDLKTQNVFLTKDGVIKLGDFGISAVLQTSYELRRTVCGTPYYFSPELCLNRPYNNKSDVWALGCVLYEMTTLRHAFDGNSMKALVQKILKGAYPPISTSHYSPELIGLVKAMLQLDPQKRPNVSQIIRSPFMQTALQAFKQEVHGAVLSSSSLIPRVEQEQLQREAERFVQRNRKREELEELRRVSEENKKERENVGVVVQPVDNGKRRERVAGVEALALKQRTEKAEGGNPSAVTEAYVEARQQAALNKQRCYQEELGIQRKGRAREPLPVQPASPHEKEDRSRTTAPAIEPDARAEVFWQMRQEAERNRRRLLGLDDDNEETPSLPYYRMSEGPRAEALEDVDGAGGLRSFLNAEAITESTPAHDVPLEDYGDLENAIDGALELEAAEAADFDDHTSPDTASPIKFLLDQQTLKLGAAVPGESISLIHRIELLRFLLENELGEDKLLQCYKTMNSTSEDNDDHLQGVSMLLSPEELQRYAPLIAQLIVCEDVVNNLHQFSD